MRSHLLALTLALTLGACGGAAPAPEASAPSAASAPPGTPRDAEAEAKKKAEDEAARQIPTKCAEGVGDGKHCLPPPAFAARLCQGSHPDVALALFARGTPFTRAYLAADVEAWYASGGPSSSGKLVFEEEVLLLVHRAAAAGGMTVSGAGGGYDVLRWDGTCASLSEGELRFRVPSRPKSAPIPWKSLDLKIRDALEADEKVGKAVAGRRSECKGAAMGSVTAKCEKADKLMGQAIVDYVRSGGALPAPGALPP